MPSFILSLDEITARDAARIGGKALRLGELRQAGLNVPPGFVITTDAYRVFLEANGLHREIESLLARFHWESAEFKNEMAQLQSRLRAQPLPAEIQHGIEGAISQLQSRTAHFAVRSSTLSEDSAEASFAGQYDTYLNCQSLMQVVDAVKACWASLWNERVIAYRHRANRPRFDAAMGVVVQTQIPSVVSGVIFTLNPLTGREEQMMIEASWGLGEAIVSGRVTPDHFVVDWLDARVLSREIADKAVMSVPDVTGTRDAYAETPSEKRNALSLNDEQLLALAELGQRVQAHYGFPQDIEWALWQNEFYILQARPLTAVNFTADYGQWTSANFREVMPGFVSPFSASVSLMHDYPRSLSEFMAKVGMILPGQTATEGRLFFGRAFWRFDLVKECVARLPGFKERAFDETIGIEPSYEGDGRTTPFNLATIARGLPILLRLNAEYEKFWKEAEAFKKRFEIEEREFLAVDRARLSDDDLATWIHKTLDIHWRTNRIAMTVSYLSTQAQDDLRGMIYILNRARPADIEPLVMANLLTGLGNVVTARPIAEIENLAHAAHRAPRVAQTVRESSIEELPARLQAFDAGRAFWAQFQDFVQRFRFLAEVDEDFALPRYDEDATIPLRVLKQMLDTGTQHDVILSEAKNLHHGSEILRSAQGDRSVVRECEEARARELGARFARGLLCHLWKSKTRVLDLLAAFQFDEQLEIVRRYIWWREETRERVARAHYLCHRFFGELGRRWAARGIIEEPGDIFLLTQTQILDALSVIARSGFRDEAIPSVEVEIASQKPLAMTQTLRTSIRRYKKMRAAYRNFEVPWTINVSTKPSAETPGVVQTVWRGVPCGGGRVCAPARIIRDPLQSNRLQKSEILVAPYTNPNWTPLFSLAAGIVMEEGGLLSHGAVIAREVGIPAVLQIKRATQIFHDGQMLCVDGTRGIVEVVG